VRLNEEIEELKKRIEQEKTQREDGLNILKNELAHAVKMEKEKDNQAKVERRKEKEKIKKKKSKKTIERTKRTNPKCH